MHLPENSRYVMQLPENLRCVVHLPENLRYVMHIPENATMLLNMVSAYHNFCQFQIPVSEVRSDGRENLVCSLIIAGNLNIPEVAVYFNNKLMRGNRCIKLDNSALEAFDSPNMSPIARLEINIKGFFTVFFFCLSVFGDFAVEKRCRNTVTL